MASNIRILPSGRDFISEGKSTLLEAGLRSGLALAYGCSNGNCGQCLAEIVSGEVQKVHHHDYRITDAKKVSGHVLMCCNTAVTDVILKASEAHSSSEITQQQITTIVKNIEIVNGDVALIHVKTPRSSRLRFLAGQHVQLGGSNMPVAHHSVGSCPCDDMNLHFQIPRLPGDEFSEYVFNQLEKGEPLNIVGPKGDFVLNEDSQHPLVFIVWRTGFAPVRGLIEHAMALDVTEAIHLVWITGNKKDRYLDNLCRSWEDALDNFNYVPVDADPGAGVVDTGSTFELLNIKPNDLADHDFYIAGNNLLVDCYSRVLINSGLPAEQLRLDPLEHL